MTPQVVLSFDVEEFDIPGEFGQPLAPQEQGRIGRMGLEVVADFLERHRLAATLFVTAHFASQYPDLIRHLARHHEIASHGWTHSGFDPTHPAMARKLLQEISGQLVTGFRMPRLAPVCGDDLAAAGYRYNSSENPIWLPGRYNNLRQPRRPYRRSGLWQVPVSASPGVRFPLFWLGVKNFPMVLVRREARRTLAYDGHVNFYFHPWEFVDISAYRLPWYVRRHAGRGMLDRLEDLVQSLRPFGEFCTFSQCVETWDKAGP